MIKIKPNIKKALADQQLQKNLHHTLVGSLKSRDAAVSEVENWEELRSYARQVKRHTIKNLSLYLAELEEKVKANGGKVVWAENGREAVEYILKLARDKGVTSMVKSKTMLGEEIDLNHFLSKNGVEVVETDLGEYIVQLGDERPSHIVTPAMHLSKEEVADLFARKLNMERTDDIHELTLTARNTLRDKFLTAGMGLSGVNFAVAETGSIVVVENEGNARLSMSAPPVHVAIMGIEKVLPRTRDLAVMLKLLTRSATGQKASSYFNFISGPRRKGECDGPTEFHLVLIDNGRSKILADPYYRQALTCLRCGICLNTCPVFQSIGGHAYGSVYQGPIGCVLTPQLEQPGESPDHPYASSLCGACGDICPVKIELPDLLLRLRADAVQNRSFRTIPERIMMKLWAWFFSDPERYGFSGRKGRAVTRRLMPAFRKGLAPPPLRLWMKERDLPEIPPKSFRELYRKEEK